jgi:hypothetical protein
VSLTHDRAQFPLKALQQFSIRSRFTLVRRSAFEQRLPLGERAWLCVDDKIGTVVISLSNDEYIEVLSIWMVVSIEGPSISFSSISTLIKK